MILSRCIVQSLKSGEMDAALPRVLLTANHSQVIHHEETQYWDYKEYLELDNPVETAKFARDILGFHNTKGGVIVVGVSKDYHVTGLTIAQTVDTYVIQEKLRKYIGTSLQTFRELIQLPNNKFIWLIFIPKRQGTPVAVATDGPIDRGQLVIHRGDYYIRKHDQTKKCLDPIDYECLFTGFSTEHLLAYGYEVDEPFFRLLSPHCGSFVGREEKISEVKEALGLRHPIISLEGVGGVGKTAVAIELVRRLYQCKEYDFIVSLSAKSRIWHKHIQSRKAGFSGFTEFLQEIARVFQLPLTETSELESLEKSVAIYMATANKGLLLVDNIEDVQDQEILDFLVKKVPDPVKVLVTSRVSRGLGALPVLIPEMNQEEARKLFLNELEINGYTQYINEEQYVDDILVAAGCIPLALKWAAVLAADKGDLKGASQELRNASGVKREFLNFSFATMFDNSLSPLAQSTALLCPYLGNEWNTLTVSVALDRPESEIGAAIEELKEKGVLVAPRMGEIDKVWPLPLTLDFLAQKWHENQILRMEVNRRLAEVFSSERNEPIFNLPPERKAEILKQRAFELRSLKEYEKALLMVRLAQQSLPREELRFLEGRIRYEKGDYSEGIWRMRQIMDTNASVLSFEEHAYYAEALLRHGTQDDELQAISLLTQSIPNLANVSHELIETYCSVALQAREVSSIRTVLERTNNGLYLWWLLESLWDNLESSMFIHWCGNSLIRALHNATPPEASKKDLCIQKAQNIQGMLNKESTAS